MQFTALLRTKLVRDMLFLYNERQRAAHVIVELGPDVCGHAKVVHGGLLSAINDEAYGALVYSMKYHQQIPAAAAVTANLSVNYRKVRAVAASSLTVNLLQFCALYAHVFLLHCCFLNHAMGRLVHTQPHAPPPVQDQLSQGSHLHIKRIDTRLALIA